MGHPAPQHVSYPPPPRPPQRIHVCVNSRMECRARPTALLRFIACVPIKSPDTAILAPTTGRSWHGFQAGAAPLWVQANMHVCVLCVRVNAQSRVGGPEAGG